MRKVIINGGEGLKDCPGSWNEATEWAEKANREGGPVEWRFDCGYKLDYDGPLVGISSRFYPPKEFYGEGWDGSVCIDILGNTICSKKFKCETLEDLKTEVEEHVAELKDQVLKLITNFDT